MSHRLVSVIIPAYNAERFVADAIDSVLGQTYPNIELIVVDDGSTDGTARIVQSYGDRLRYFHQPNQRQAVARNHGLRHASGELIAFLDADDLWLPEKLRKQVDLWKSRPELGLVHCTIQEIDEHGSPLKTCPTDLRGDCLVRIILADYVGVGSGSTALLPRSVFETIGDFDPDLPPCEDSDFLWRVASRYPIDFVPEPLVLYRLHAQNSHRNLERAARGWTKLYRKVFQDERVRQLGWSIRRRAHARLEYLLAGYRFDCRRPGPAVYHGLRAALWWPPMLPKLVSRLIHHLFKARSAVHPGPLPSLRPGEDRSRLIDRSSETPR